MGKLSTTRLAFLAVAVAAAFPVLAQVADAATVDQATLEKGVDLQGGSYSFTDTNASVTMQNTQQIFIGYNDNKEPVYINTKIGLTGTTDNISSLAIKSNSIHFGSNAEITASGSTINPGEGLNNFAAWQAGNSSLTIETNKLTIGDNEKSADRGFQMKGANNHLTILADEIVAYVGDGFINAQGTDGSSKVLIGTETNRIKHFEAHTTYGKDDWGVALLQANEGNTVSLYADEAILDGSRGPEGGVIGSGGWGTVIVDANKLTIDGNICGTYGKMSNPGQQLTLSVRAGTLDMTGDINVGNEATTNSNFDRNTTVEIEADVLNLKGNINVANKKAVNTSTTTFKGDNDSSVNLIVNKTANITGTIIASQTNGTSTVTLGGAGDATASSGKYKAELGGSIVFKGSDSWVINEWEGTDGKLEASESVKVDVNGAVQTASATLNGTSTLTLNDGAKITSATLEGSGGTFLVNTADEQVINIGDYKNTDAQAAARTISMRQLTKQSKLWKPLSALIQS
jgi:hypothetical protein